MKPLIQILLFLLIITSCISCTGSDQKIYTDLNSAVQTAKNFNKPVLAVYSKPDDCYACLLLKKEVFDTEAWNDNYQKSFIFASFNADKSVIGQDKSRKNYLKKIKKKYAIEQYPAVMLLDSNGNIYAKTGYLRGGPENYYKHLTKTVSNRWPIFKKRLDGYNNAAADKKKQLVELLETLDKWNLLNCYPELVAQLPVLDPGNKTGKAAELAYRFFVDRYGKVRFNSAKYLNYLKNNSIKLYNKAVVHTLFQEIEREFLSRNDWKGAMQQLQLMTGRKELDNLTSQKLYYKLGSVEYQMQNIRSVIRYYLRAIRLAPKTELADRLRKRIVSLRKRL